MSKIEEKAKTFGEIRDWLKEVANKVPYDHEEFKRRQKTKWVRLSDHQQEVDCLKDCLRKSGSTTLLLSEDLQKCERERGLQKQKLGEHVKRLLQLIPSEDKILRYDEETKESWIVVTADPEQWRGFSDRLDKWFLELKELLK